MNRKYDFAFAGHGWYTFKHGELSAEPDDRRRVRFLLCYEMHSGGTYTDATAKVRELLDHEPRKDADIVGWSYVDSNI